MPGGIMLAASSAVLALVCAACGLLPRDPQGTLERVSHGEMRVGLIDRHPWTSPGDGEPTGVEVELVRALAEDLDAEVRWVEGTEAVLLDALEHQELDLVVGGLTDRNPWRHRVTFTRPYWTSRLVVGVPPDQAEPEDLEERPVAVEHGTAAGGLVRDAGGIPRPVADLRAASGPAAAEDWRLDELGLRATEIVLMEQHHVMAVPPGENAWLVRLERFLVHQAGNVPSLLETHA